MLQARLHGVHFKRILDFGEGQRSVLGALQHPSRRLPLTTWLQIGQSHPAIDPEGCDQRSGVTGQLNSRMVGNPQAIQKRGSGKWSWQT